MEIKYMRSQVGKPVGEQVERLARLAAFMDESAKEIYISQRNDNDEEVDPLAARLVSACLIISELSKEEIREEVENLKAPAHD